MKPIADLGSLVWLLSSSLSAAEAPSLPPALEKALAKIEARHLTAHLHRLASDEFAGRAPGTPGEALTVQYLAAQLAQLGLEPGNPDGTYFQKVPLVGYRSVPKIELQAGGQRLTLRFPDDFVHDRVAQQPRASQRPEWKPGSEFSRK
jgi:hypothetical protein